MAYSYGGQINLDQSIQFNNNKAPLDIRVTVPTLEDLAQIEQPYVGLITYVVEEETAYICKSVGSTTGTSEWIKIKGSGGSGSVYMGDIRPELDPEQEFDEDTENRAIWIDTHDGLVDISWQMVNSLSYVLFQKSCLALTAQA